MKKLLIFTTMLLIMLTLVACGSNPEHKHTYANTYSYDDNYHWYAATCSHTNEVSNRVKHSLNLNLQCECGYEKTTANTFPGDVASTIHFDMYNSKFQVNINNTLYQIETFDKVIYQNKYGTETYVQFLASSYELYYINNNVWEKQLFEDDISMEEYFIKNYPEIANLSSMVDSIPNRFRYDSTTNTLILFQEGQWEDTDFFDFTAIYHIKDNAVLYIEFDFMYKNVDYEVIITNNSEYEFPEVASEGLDMILSNNEYIITGLGHCDDRNIVIPSHINGIPVVEIAKDAFKNNEQIESVFIPGSVINIGMSAFESCHNLNSVTIDNGTKYIGAYAFAHISPYSFIQFTDSIETIGENAFLDNTGYVTKGTWNFIGDINKYVEIDFGEGASTPNKNRDMYHNGIKLEIVVIDTAESIAAYAFSDLQTPKEYHIGKQVKNIGKSALGGFGISVLPNGVSSFVPYSVYYEGSLNEFFEINFESYWAVGSGFLLYCDNVLIENLVIENRTSVPDGIFANCVSIKSLEIKYGVRSIGEWSFYACPLEFVDLAESITYFGSYSFSKDTLYPPENSVFIEYDNGIYLSVGYNTYYLLVEKLSPDMQIHPQCLYSINFGE